VGTREELALALDRIGAPAILKTRRFGYDGKGQARIMAAGEADAAWDAVDGAPSILEGFVRFEEEFSIILCRSASGKTVTWDAPRNIHADGILRTSAVPAPPGIAPAAEEARELARKVAEALDYVGVLTLEFFATPEGAVFNEMAPRVHNSGHWTIEGALTSQFENHIRAVCGLPLGAIDRVAPKVTMQNLIGDDSDAWHEILSDPAARLHLYGKGEPRPGRKMGHVTRLVGAAGD
jgi:5-(carboxyamino)imidazole ribonucleotide synthase